MSNELTDQEKKVINLTAELWNEYLKLPDRYLDEQETYRQNIHSLQALIAVRLASRILPEFLIPHRH